MKVYVGQVIWLMVYNKPVSFTITNINDDYNYPQNIFTDSGQLDITDKVYFSKEDCLAVKKQEYSELTWLKNLSYAAAYCGFNSTLFIDSLIRWVESGKKLTAKQYEAATNISRAVAKYIDRNNNTNYDSMVGHTGMDY